MAEKKKPTRVKARVPRGFVDRGPADLRAQEAMLATIREVYESYGFEPVETPFLEYTDALGKFLPDADRPNEGVFSLRDEDEEWMSLRYDLTAPLARYVAENFEDLPKPYRSYRAGYVFRNEKPGPGRFRQFMQFDADIVGAPSVSADAEMAMMMADTMEALGIPRGQYVIRVNNRKVLDGVMEAIGLGGEENAGKRLTVLRAIDKLDKFGVEGVRLLLGPGRKDESGDFTPGADLDKDTAEILLEAIAFDELTEPQIGYDSFEFPNPYYSPPKEWNREQLARAGRIVELNSSGITREPHAIWYYLGVVGSLYELNDTTVSALNEIEAIADQIIAAGYDDGRVKVDPSVVRGLEYYTGPVFEAELLFDVVNEKGEKVRFGSVGGGGRYDGLVSRFLATPVPATGFSIGVSRLQAALKNLGRLKDEVSTGPVVVTVMDRDRMADYQAMASTLRKALNPVDEAGKPLGPVVPVEVFQGNPKQFGKQLQYADRRGSPVVIIQGGDEKAAGKVQVKDLALGKELSAGIEDNAEWREARAGQELVDEADLVAAVKAILDRRPRG